jgi:chaperonin GroEL (HSP60 family)
MGRRGGAAEVLPILEQITRVDKPLLIIADQMKGESLVTRAVNTLRGTLSAWCRKGPGVAYGFRYVWSARSRKPAPTTIARE